MIIWQLVVGVLLIIGTLISLVLSIVKTPENLRGWYGLMFGCISAGGFIGGIALILASLAPIL